VSDLMRMAIALGLTLPAAGLLIAGMKLDNPDLKSAGMWVGGFANGYMATDAFYQWGRSREEG
jgi:hypothetical protein